MTWEILSLKSELIRVYLFIFSNFNVQAFMI